jgi:hypothetical protein
MLLASLSPPFYPWRERLPLTIHDKENPKMNKESIANLTGKTNFSDINFFGIKLLDDYTVINKEDIIAANYCSKTDKCISNMEEGESYYDAEGNELSLQDRINDIFEHGGLLYIKDYDFFVAVRDKKIIHLNINGEYLDKLNERISCEDDIMRQFGCFIKKVVTYNKRDQKEKTEYFYNNRLRLCFNNNTNKIITVAIGLGFDWLLERIM